MGAKKNRKSPRAQVSLVARYRSPTAFEFVSEECFDLSVGGMFIKSPAPAPAGTLLKLECDVDEGSAKIRGVARVVWLREHAADGHPAGMGVKFVKLDPGGREVIHGILERVGAEVDDGGEARRSSLPAAPEPFKRSPSSRPEPLGAGSDLAAGMQVSSEAITVRPPSGPAGAPPNVAFVNDTQPVPASSPSSAGGERAASRQDARGLRERLEQAKRGANDGPAAGRKPASGAKAQKAKPATTSAAAARGAPALAKPAPSAAARTGGRAWVYVVIALLAATGVYALSTRRATPVETTPEMASEAANPPAPEPAPAPQPVPTAAVEPPPAAQPTAIAVEAKPAAPPHYVLEIVTKPEGAKVTVGSHSVVAPGEIELGDLTDTVVLKAEKKGYQSAAARIDRVGFMLDEGALRRRIVLKLTEEPEREPREKRRKPEPAKSEEPPKAEQPAKSAEPAAAEPQIKITPAPETQPATPEASAPKPAPAPAAAPPALETKPAETKPAETKPAETKPAETKPEAAKPKPSSKQTPLQTATACLSTGDNACVVAALEGKAKTAQELEMLIETFRVMGNAEKAEKYMQVYLKKYPTERRSVVYGRVLERRQAESGGAAAP